MASSFWSQIFSAINPFCILKSKFTVSKFKLIVEIHRVQGAIDCKQHLVQELGKYAKVMG